MRAARPARLVGRGSHLRHDVGSGAGAGDERLFVFERGGRVQCRSVDFLWSNRG